MKISITGLQFVAIAVVVFFAVAVSRANADVHSPWVLSEHVADTSSMKAFANFPAWKDKHGQERAIAIWKYLCDKETGVFHFTPIREGQDRRNSELHIIRDPVKMLNSYGYGFCGAFGPTTAGIFERTGFEKARAIGIPGCNHCVTEVWYDGDWHYFDVDIRGVLFERDGKTIASIRDVIEQPDLWTRPAKKILPFFTNDPDLSVYARSYGDKPVEHLHGWSMHGATMDYRLRRGETFTRWWRPQGGRWAHQEQDIHNDWWRNLLRRTPYGAKSNHANFSIWTHGNGLFDYRPTLREGAGDFADGVFDQKNVVLTDDGLTLRTDGRGEAIFEVLSPYVIVPKVGDLETREDDREASVVDFSSRGNVRVSISLDFGRSWKEIASVSTVKQSTLDLTPQLRQRYQYLIKFTLSGKAQRTVLETLRIQTWVQVAPASLPRLKKGANHLRYKTGDQHGLPTTPWMQTPSMASREAMSRYWVREPNDYDPDRFQRRVRGEMELLFAAPAGRKIKWASLGGFFAAHRGDAAGNTKNQIFYTTDDSDDWKRLYKADVPDWNDHWHYSIDKDVVLDQPAGFLRVRYVGDPGVNGVRVNLHSIRPNPTKHQTIVVTHGFESEGQLVRRRFKFDKPTEYTIDCKNVPTNVFVQFAVASDSEEPIAGAATESGAKPATERGGVKRSNLDEPEWIAEMQQVHSRFTGEKGVFALFGDSITISRAFWFGLPHGRKNAPKEMETAFGRVNKHMLKDCWDRKGPQFGNQGSMTIRWADKNVDRWLGDLNPEVALIMFGTNDLHQLKLEEYQNKTREVVKRCLDNGTVVILSTIPPRHGHVQKSAKFAGAVRKIARDLKVPLTDFHAEILRRRPDDWDGALDKFKDYKGFDVPTLIARDGVHPSNPQKYRNDYSAEGLRHNGFVLRNYLALLKYAEVIRHALEKDQAAGRLKVTTQSAVGH